MDRRKRKETGWAWKPDAKTTASIARGNRKLARHKRKFDSSPKGENTMATKTTKTTRTRKAAAKAPAKAAPAEKRSNVISLKELLRKSDLDPKVARRRLRAAKLAGHDPKARWEFTPAQARKARSALGI